MLDDATRGEIVRLYWSGLGGEKIQAQLALPYTVVVQALIEAGGKLTRHVRSPISDERLQEAEALLEQGASREEVVKTTGVNQKALKAWFPEYHWTNQQSGEYAWVKQKYNRMIAKEWKV